MAAAVYGGSPRHHSRMLVSSSSGSKHSSSHLSSALALQQSTPFISGCHQQQQQSTIIIPPASYMTSSPHHHLSSSQQQHQQHQQQQQQQHQQLLREHHHQQQHHAYMQNQRSSHHSKRKSAVELLAETKQYYVKSETVRERQQQLHFSRNASQQAAYIVSPSRTLPHHRSSNRRSASSSSDLLQTKLRKLLNAGDSKETITPDSIKYASDSPSHYDSFQYSSPKSLNQELTVHPSSASEQQSDLSVFFPSAFLSPQSLPPHPASDDDLYSYGIDDGLTDDYGTISPPAEYAGENDRSHNDQQSSGGGANRYGYQRSYSHSQTVMKDTGSPYNINSHKSLPDLHSQISRHSPHSEVLSCCSRGNRSNKSSSSFNRDSGGSSGHYTHRSEPLCCKQKEPSAPPSTTTIVNPEFRRDSGSSTQHSGNSYYNNYGVITNYQYDCVECRAKLNQQQQQDSECLLNFTTPEVPEAFQDDYLQGGVGNKKINNNSRYYESASSPRKYYSNQKSQSPPPPPIPDPPMSDPAELSPPLGTFKRQKCLRFKHRARYPSPSQSSQQQQQQDDDRRPILRSKSDIGDRYWNRTMPIIDSPPMTTNTSSASQQQHQHSTSSSSKMEKSSNLVRGKSESLSQLEKFFDHLGLNEETFDQYIAPQPIHSDNEDSDQYLSDVSTVDSNRLPDSTETNPQNAAMYRPSEPPSIVERNARIIKWLCNCRKLQMAQI